MASTCCLQSACDNLRAAAHKQAVVEPQEVGHEWTFLSFSIINKTKPKSTQQQLEINGNIVKSTTQVPDCSHIQKLVYQKAKEASLVFFYGPHLN